MKRRAVMSNSAGKKKSHRGITLLVIFIVVAGAFAARFLILGGGKSIANIRSIQEKEGKPVEVIETAKGDVEVWTTLAGTVEGIVQYPIVSTNSIQVMDVLRREGDHVKPGDIIIRLEKAAVNPMLHSYDRSRALYEDALADARRMRDLYEEGAVSKQALDKTEMALKIAESDLTDAREGIDLAADHAGIVTSVLVGVGEMAENGHPVAWISRLDSVKIAFQAGSRQALILEKGQKAVWKNSGTGEIGEGVVSKLDLSADRSTHLLGGEALFANTGGRLVPGLLVSFDVLTAQRRGVITVPPGCIVESGGEEGIFLAVGTEGKMTAVFRKVETGLRTADRVEIVDGLKEGDMAILFGQSKINNGDLVKVVSSRKGD